MNQGLVFCSGSRRNVIYVQAYLEPRRFIGISRVPKGSFGAHDPGVSGPWREPGAPGPAGPTGAPPGRGPRPPAQRSEGAPKARVFGPRPGSGRGAWAHGPGAGGWGPGPAHLEIEPLRAESNPNPHGLFQPTCLLACPLTKNLVFASRYIRPRASALKPPQ